MVRGQVGLLEFQVAVKPQAQDVGRHIVLAKRATYSARDVYVGEVLKGRVDTLTTEITAEPVEKTRTVEYEQEVRDDERVDMVDVMSDQ